MKLLLVEDDRGISQALQQALSTVYNVDAAPTGTLGIQKATTGDYQLIVLDLNLPDMHGLEVCEQLRRSGITAPILILTGDASILRKITLLDSGANDYLTKPFSLGELKARLRVLERLVTDSTPPHQYLCTEDLSLDTATRQVERNGVVIKLRRKEFAMLQCLMQNAGSVVTREVLTSHAWRGSDDPWTNTIDVHIKYLRDKIDRPFPSQLIKTVHGVGYKLEAQGDVAKNDKDSKKPVLPAEPANEHTRVVPQAADSPPITTYATELAARSKGA